MKKVKRKLWVTVFGGYTFDQVIEMCREMDIEVLVGFKPSMMVDMHLGLKGSRESIELLKSKLVKKKHEIANRCPSRSFRFDI